MTDTKKPISVKMISQASARRDRLPPKFWQNPDIVCFCEPVRQGLPWDTSCQKQYGSLAPGSRVDITGDQVAEAFGLTRGAIPDMPTLEHYFQSAKYWHGLGDSRYREYLRWFSKTSSAEGARALGQQRNVLRVTNLPTASRDVSIDDLLERYAGDGVSPDPKWSEQRVEVMTRLLQLRFKLDRNFRELLMSTARQRLVYFTFRRGFWGSGPPQHDRSRHAGLNIYGQILTQLRSGQQVEVEQTPLSQNEIVTRLKSLGHANLVLVLDGSSIDPLRQIYVDRVRQILGNTECQARTDALRMAVLQSGSKPKPKPKPTQQRPDTTATASTMRLQAMQLKTFPNIVERLRDTPPESYRKQQHWAWYVFPTSRAGASDREGTAVASDGDARWLLRQLESTKIETAGTWCTLLTVWAEILARLADAVSAQSVGGKPGRNVLPSIDHGRVKFFISEWVDSPSRQEIVQNYELFNKALKRFQTAWNGA